MSNEKVLECAGFGCSFGTRVILAEVDFSVEARSVHILMGPAGTGKSSLLRSLAGLNEPNPRYKSWGSSLYQGRPAADGHRPRLVQQHARLMQASVMDNLLHAVRSTLTGSPPQLKAWAENYLDRMGLPELKAQLLQPTMTLPVIMQRAVGILREAALKPRLLMIDEPSADLAAYDCYVLFELLKSVARESTLLVVLHNQKQAQDLGSHVTLLAGGRVQESSTLESFFQSPGSAAAQQFVRTGSCALPAPDADPATLSEDITPPPPLPIAARLAVQGQRYEPRAPRGFSWAVRGKVAGTPMPGAVAGIDYDLAALKQVGITKLITLTERDLPQDSLARHGLTNLHLPIRDREPPTVAQTNMLLIRMNALLDKGEVLAVHCLAGIGRTGTILACWLIREGLTAKEALRRIRTIDRAYVQSAEQEDFLQTYEESILKKVI